MQKILTLNPSFINDKTVSNMYDDLSVTVQ